MWSKQEIACFQSDMSELPIWIRLGTSVRGVAKINMYKIFVYIYLQFVYYCINLTHETAISGQVRMK